MEHDWIISAEIQHDPAVFVLRGAIQKIQYWINVNVVDVLDLL